MLIKSRALVLRTLKHNDTASVAVLFTEVSGMVSFLVRLPKGHKAGSRSKLFQPLAILEIEWDQRDKESLQHPVHVRNYYPYATLPLQPYKTTIALFISEYLYYSLRDEQNGQPLFDYLFSSLQWLDLTKRSVANFHLVFLLRLSRFLGFYPNAEDYCPNDLFDLENSCFTHITPDHSYYLSADEAAHLPLLLRMNFDTMHLFQFNRTQRNRLLDIINEYYRLHIPNFPQLKSLEVLREVFE